MNLASLWGFEEFLVFVFLEADRHLSRFTLIPKGNPYQVFLISLVLTVVILSFN